MRDPGERFEVRTERTYALRCGAGWKTEEEVPRLRARGSVPAGGHSSRPGRRLVAADHGEGSTSRRVEPRNVYGCTKKERTRLEQAMHTLEALDRAVDLSLDDKDGLDDGSDPRGSVCDAIRRIVESEL